MALEDDLRAEVKTIFKETWTKRTGQVVPEPSDLKLENDSIEFDRATVLYADLSGSTSMVNTKEWPFAAEVYKTYLYCAAKLIRHEGGTVTAYDGDRVMGVFIGDHQTTSAIRCALRINYAVSYIVNPALAAQYPSANFLVRQVVGVDTSPIRAVRTGVRGGNDIVWVGRAANHAAKLTDIDLAERSWITNDAFIRTNDEMKVYDSKHIWKKYTWTKNGNEEIYGSDWWWRI
jgi:class 3 adenylate cyclase